MLQDNENIQDTSPKEILQELKKYEKTKDLILGEPHEYRPHQCFFRLEYSPSFWKIAEANKIPNPGKRVPSNTNLFVNCCFELSKKSQLNRIKSYRRVRG